MNYILIAIVSGITGMLYGFKLGQKNMEKQFHDMVEAYKLGAGMR